MLQIEEGRYVPGVLDDLELVGCLVQGPSFCLNAPPLHEQSTFEWRDRALPLWPEGQVPSGDGYDVFGRPIIRNLHLRETMWHCNLGGFVLEDCTWSGLHTGPVSGGALALLMTDVRHLTLEGHVGVISIDGSGDDRFYRDVDWALDIREASFSDADFNGIPPDKIRRNPELHVVLRAENADLKRLMRVRGVKYASFVNTLLQMSLGRRGDTLLMAHPRGKAFKLDLAAINALRKEGLVA